MIKGTKQRAKTLFQRFYSKALIGDNCWIWTAHRNENGYGRFSFEGRPVLAPRMAWFLRTGQRPTQNVLHKCDNPACVRPSHLFLGNQQDNVTDCVKKGRQVSHNAFKTRCMRGHPFDQKNTYIRYGKRHCRMCRWLWKRGKI